MGGMAPAALVAASMDSPDHTATVGNRRRRRPEPNTPWVMQGDSLPWHGEGGRESRCQEEGACSKLSREIMLRSIHTCGGLQVHGKI